MTAADIEARNFTYCSAVYHEPLRFEKFLVPTGLVKKARPIALRYATAAWGEPVKLYLYPRTYVKEARALFAEGRYFAGRA